METLSDKDIQGYFSVIRGIGNHLGSGKLDVARELIAELNKPLGSLCLIGDTIHDHEVASELGIPCILVAHGHQSYSRLLALGCPVVNDLRELDSLF